MRVGRFYRARKRVLPLVAVVVVLSLIAVSYNQHLQNRSEAFAFSPYWPTPSDYIPNNPIPNVFLQINYTGTGSMDYSYLILLNSSVLTHGSAVVTPRSPFTLLTFAPVPSTLVAQVYSQGHLVYEQRISLG